MPGLIFTSLNKLNARVTARSNKAGFFCLQSKQGFFSYRSAACLNRDPKRIDSPRNRTCLAAVNGGLLCFLPVQNAKQVRNVTSTPNTRRFAVRQSSPAQSESHYPNSHGRVDSGRNPVQKRTNQGIQALNQAGARHSFAKLISPKLFTRAYPCSLRVGIGMTTR